MNSTINLQCFAIAVLMGNTATLLGLMNWACNITFLLINSFHFYCDTRRCLLAYIHTNIHTLIVPIHTCIHIHKHAYIYTHIHYHRFLHYTVY